MTFQAVITAKDRGILYDCFAPESYSGARSRFQVTKRGHDLKFNITAKDSVALKATTNGIIKLFTIAEKLDGQGN